MSCDANGLKRHLWGSTLAVVVFLLGQTFAAGWWASRVQARLDYLERDLGYHLVRLEKLEDGR